MLSNFGFDVPSTTEEHSCCDICYSDCQCSECVSLHQDVSAFGDLCVVEGDSLFSRNQIKVCFSIKRKLRPVITICISLCVQD